MAASPPTRASARNFLVASSTMIPDQQLTVANAVREGARLQAVTTAGIIRELSLRSHALKDDSLHGRMQLHCHNNALDCSRFPSLPGPAPTGRENIIISREEAAVEWGRMLFYYFLSGSEKVDLNTF